MESSQENEHKENLKKNVLEAFEKLMRGDFTGDENPFIKNGNYFLRLRKELINESDRGCVLLAVSHIDYRLEEMLRFKLIGSKKHLDELFGLSGPLGALSAKVKMAYSLGLLSKNEFSDIEVMRKIRNECAHKIEPISLLDNKIKSQIQQLKTVDSEFHKDVPKKRFITAVGVIMSRVEGLTLENKKYHEPKEAPVVPKEFVDVSTKHLLEVLVQQGADLSIFDPLHPSSDKKSKEDKEK